MRMMLDLLHASHCRSTHHKLALDALHHLRCPGRERWTRLILKHYERYLQGAKDPDKKFRDFRNHVLHVRDNYWGGAITAAELWYHEVVESLKSRDFPGAVYAAGVLSHYVTDPVMPFHTGQSEAETNIHRAAEWSVATTYDALVTAAAARGAPPKLEPSSDDDWLAEMVIAGAEEANQHYETLIEHYDFALGSRNPKAGWDATGREILGRLLIYSAASFAKILERAIDEADVDPPHVELFFETIFATMQVPIRYVARRIDDYQQGCWIEEMYEEWQQTGRVEEYLAEDDRAIRDLYAKEVAVAKQAAARQTKQIQQQAEQSDRCEALARARAAVGSKPNRGEFQQQQEDRGRARRKDSQPVARSDAESKTMPARVDEAHSESPVRNRLAAARSSVGALSSSISAKVRDRFRREENEQPGKLATAEPERDAFDDDFRRSDSATQADDIDRRLEQLEREFESDRSEPVRSDYRDDDVDHDAGDAAGESPDGPFSIEDRFYIELESPVQEAPSVGPKTARRLAKIGVRTVADLLEIKDRTDAVSRIGQRWITEQTIEDWQDQASLAVRIPNLRGHDAQILVACGFRMPEEVAACKPADILKVTIPFCDSPEGKRILRNGKAPDKHEVRNWIDWAGRARE